MSGMLRTKEEDNNLAAAGEIRLGDQIITKKYF